MPLANRLRRIASDVVQYEPLRQRARYGGAALLEVRGMAAERVGRRRTLRNIYGTGMQKAGSQWAKAVFDHELVSAATGLATFPTLAYADRVFRNRFPAYCFVPDLYLSYPEYAAIKKRAPFRTFHLVRDPRDIVVSWYFSVRDTHRVFGPIAELRRELLSVTTSEGLLVGIKFLEPQLNGMKTWIGVSEPEIAFFRLEEVRDQPEAELRRLLSHCEVQLTNAMFEQVLRDTSREELRKRDLQRRAPREESHYRQEPSQHSKYFEAIHHDTLRELTGDLVESLGYS